jgi:hypothetical protein
MKRTLDQNAYYHGVVVAEALKFYEANPAELYHDVARCIKDEEGKEIIHSMLKILFNGGHSTKFKDDEAGTGTQKMSTYVDKIREYYYHTHHFDIPPANTEKIDFEKPKIEERI